MAASLKDYLKKYESNAKQEKKKQKKKKNKTTLNSILVVDEDPLWQMTTKLEELPNKSDDEEKPQVDEDIDIKRMKRLELLRSRKPYHSISEDGSGWVSVSETSNILNSDDPIFDMSPPRKRRARNDDTPSPNTILRDSAPASSAADPPSELHQKRKTEELDLSPPRKQHKNREVRSLSSCLKEQENGENKNFLSLRKLTGNADITSVSSAQENEQRSGYDSDLSPSRKFRKSNEIDDLSPPRRKNQISSCPKQRNLKSIRDASVPRKSKRDISQSNEHHKSGLITGRDMKEDNLKHMAAEWNRFEEMDPLTSGRGSEPVYRDKITGERIQKEEFLGLQKKKEKTKNDKFEWGKGLAQKREAEAKLDDLEREKNKPFARTRDDPDLDKMLKERVRWGDPMAHLVKKKEGGHVLRDLGDSEKMKESGFNIPQEVPDHSWIKRGFEAAQNRYGIVPGRHWDGIDRSNGFEKELFKRRNERQASEKEAYLWSVSDM